ncbi:MAG: radical SAM protein [Candidatus Aenigmatarchaeota archaeon]
MKVMLLNAPLVAGKKQKFTLQPLGILYIAGVLKQNGYEPELIDCNITDYTLEDVADLIIRKKPDIVGISVMTPQIINALKIAKMVKERDKEIKICLGGPHISSTGAEVFDFSKDVDFLIRGEGEFKFLQLVKNLNGDHSDVRGLVYRDADGKVRINELGEAITELDNLPFPDFAAFDINAYKSPYVERYPMVPLIASRGCPFKCSFCDAYRTHGRVLRKRSPKNVVDEMEHNVKHFGVGHFAVKDSTFILDKKWVGEICDEIIRRGLKIKWNCNSRVDSLDAEILDKVKMAGCVMLGLGVESGSQTVLDNIHKRTTLQQIRETFKLIQNVGLKTYAFFMIGNPGDNPENVRKTIDFAKELEPDIVAFSVTEAYPGTEICEWALKNNVLSDPRWYMRGADTFVGVAPSSASLEYPELTKEQQQVLVKRAYREFCMRPGYIFKKIIHMRNAGQIKDMMTAGLEVIRKS